MVGVGGAVHRRTSCGKPCLFTLGARDQLVVVVNSNRAATLAIQRPRQQSGQVLIRSIYDSAATLRARGNKILLRWIPASEENNLLQQAKQQAKAMTQEGSAGDVISGYALRESEYCAIQTARCPLSMLCLKLAGTRSVLTKQYPANTRRCTTNLPARRPACLYK